jgi:Tfp pilus assembly protein PilP
MRVQYLTIVMLLAAAPLAYAQKPGAPAAAQPAPAQKPATPATAQPVPAPAVAPATAPAPAASQPPAAENYTYQPDGRRDPFLSLVGVGGEQRAMSRKGEGPSGLSVTDVSVRGVMESRGVLVAMIQGPDNKTYIVHQGDKLLDGTIKTVTTQGLIVIQEVNDPLSLVKQREIRKFLRSVEDVKE